jgi:hypothetical protein
VNDEADRFAIPREALFDTDPKGEVLEENAPCGAEVKKTHYARFAYREGETKPAAIARVRKVLTRGRSQKAPTGQGPAALVDQSRHPEFSDLCHCPLLHSQSKKHAPTAEQQIPKQLNHPVHSVVHEWQSA